MTEVQLAVFSGADTREALSSRCSAHGAFPAGNMCCRGTTTPPPPRAPPAASHVATHNTGSPRRLPPSDTVTHFYTPSSFFLAVPRMLMKQWGEIKHNLNLIFPVQAKSRRICSVKCCGVSSAYSQCKVKIYVFCQCSPCLVVSCSLLRDLDITAIWLKQNKNKNKSLNHGYGDGFTVVALHFTSF